MEAFKFISGQEIPRVLNDGVLNRKYNSDSTEEEINVLKNRVFQYEKNIIYYKEIPKMSVFSTTLLLERAIEISKGFEKRGMIVDLRATARPDAEARRAVNNIFTEMSHKFHHLAFFTEGIILHNSIKFVMYGLDFISYTVSKDFNKLLLEMREKVNE